MQPTSRRILRHELLAGRTAFGAIIGSDTPLLIDLCGLAGFDFVFLDTEHGSLLHPNFEHLVRAADASDLPVIARVARDQPIEIGRALDIGCQGVHLPFVETAVQAQSIVTAARFHPAGQRGLGPVRAARYGTDDFGAFVTRSNDETLVVVAIETPAAVDQIAAIGAVPGVDLIFVAPADLSVMVGRPGQFDHPEVQAVITRAIEAARATGKLVGSLATSPAHAQQLVAQGVQYILLVLNGIFVRSMSDWLGAARGSDRVAG